MEKYINFKNGIEDNKLTEISEKLKKGAIVIFPTETVYGIGTNCFNENSVRKIYEIKKRPKSKALSLLISDFKMVSEIATDISKEEKIIMEKFFPRTTYNYFEKI